MVCSFVVTHPACYECGSLMVLLDKGKLCPSCGRLVLLPVSRRREEGSRGTWRRALA